MKPPIKRLADLKPAVIAGAYARPTPKVVRRKTAKVLTPEEKAAFLASRPGPVVEVLSGIDIARLAA
ncbi:hypothetical protein [Caulobacter sp. UC70_42]|uniref:hypothetical protein n=1 Tax=Caulobacter sp. UC70_42 TaxID=3374551 RepID=UPI0037573213